MRLVLVALLTLAAHGLLAGQSAQVVLPTPLPSSSPDSILTVAECGQVREFATISHSPEIWAVSLISEDGQPIPRLIVHGEAVNDKARAMVDTTGKTICASGTFRAAPLDTPAITEARIYVADAGSIQEITSPPDALRLYTDEEASEIMRRIIHRAGSEPLPIFDIKRFTPTQFTLVFAGITAHLDMVDKMNAKRAADLKSVTPSWSAPAPAPETKRGLSPAELALLSTLLRPRPRIQVPFYPMPVPSSPAVTTSASSQWITGVNGNGAIVRLNDGTIWQVHDLDQIRAVLWLPIQRISVAPSNTVGESLLVNASNTQAVRATRIR